MILHNEYFEQIDLEVTHTIGETVETTTLPIGECNYKIDNSAFLTEEPTTSKGIKVKLIKFCCKKANRAFFVCKFFCIS